MRVTRRQFVCTLSAAAAVMPFSTFAGVAPRKMTMNLMCGMIGVQANQREAVELAHRHGFESVEAIPGDLAKMSDDEVKSLLENMAHKKVVFGAAGLPLEFRQEEQQFEDGMRNLPRLAAGLKRAGVKRVGTWLMPGHGTLTYFQNFKRHSERLRKAAALLRDYDVRLGLEYVGTKTIRDRVKYPFIHSMAEMLELIADIGLPNVGLVLDSWHWWQAGDSAQDILRLKGDQVIAVDLNDAPAGIPKDQQQDGRRELPLATGIIDVKSFLNALNQIGYDGPVRAEPFSKALNDMDNDPACAKTIEALRKAFALIETT